MKRIKRNLSVIVIPLPLLLIIFVIWFYNKRIESMDKETMPAASKTDALNISAIAAPPQVISIAGLPDSLQPKTTYLDKAPKPLTVVIPKREGGSYSIDMPNGDVARIMLEPPVKKMLAVLTDGKGRPIKDTSGNPFVMGTGGISNFTNFNSDDGLALDGVNCSMIDNTGNLWFGTQGGGASRYDGKSFTTFTTTQGLIDNSVTCLFQDKAGNIWFGSQGGGVSKYDGKSLTNFSTANGLVNNHITGIAEDNAGNIWLATYGAASKYDGKIFTNFLTIDGLPNNRVKYIARDKAGNMWFCTLGGASKYDGKSFTNYTTTQGLAGNVVNCMAEGKDGSLWFGTRNGVSKYNGKSFSNFSTAQGLANNNVQALAVDKLGNVWVGTFGGVSKYDGKSFSSFNTSQGLASNDVRRITEDKAGNLWISTFGGGGVSKYAGNSFTGFTTVHGLPNTLVYNITQDKAGKFWFGTTDGASQYDGKSFTNFKVEQGLPNDYIEATFVDHAGNTWLGTQAGVSKYDGKSFTTFTTAQGFPGNTVNGITEDKDGNLWFASSGGLCKYDGKSFVTYTTAQGLVNDAMSTLYKDKAGNLWLGTSGGVSRFDGKTFINFTTAQGLTNNLVNNITADKDNNLWIATQAGASRLSAKEIEKLEAPGNSVKPAPVVKFDNFSTAQGLADDMVYAMVQDKKGNMFLGTNLGYTVIPATMSALPFSQVRKGLEYYNRPNGFPVKDLNSNAMYCDSQGIIWGGTGSELVRFDYSSLEKTAEQPALIIQRIKVNGENVCWFDLQSRGKLNNREDSAEAMFQESMAYGKMLSQTERDSVIKKFGGIRFDSISGFYLLPQNPELPHDHNQVTIDFNAVETGKPLQVEYQYMLQGYDKSWSPVTKNTTATFGNMYEGEYTFMLKAREANGSWSEPITYAFKVLPPWYRSWWAYTLYALCLFAGIILTDRVRRGVVEKRLIAKAREKELEQAKEIEKAYKQLGTAHENLKATQAQLVQSEKMASLGELTAGIAHEIQNPLNFVNNFSEVNKELIDEMQQEMDKGNLVDAKAISNDIKENEEKINHHGKRADAIVKGMLQHSRTSTGVKEPTDINALADEYLRLSYHGLRAKDKEFNAIMNTDFDKSIGKINIIPQDIGRVLLNLYNNAFYVVNEKKKQQPNGYEPTISVNTKKINNTVEITVKDNGNGIPQKVIDKIFQPFFTTKPTGEGTGLGLSLSYDIVKAHGGEIKVNTIEGEFTEFVIQLPISV
jgi:ligand-binding sensor domain-containing protein/signal transduction histidine kinase